ncbi:MAG TPA: terminase family protein [Buttiauxella sp.]|jgi:uncharacterized protein YjcR
MRYEFTGLQAATLKNLLSHTGFEYQRRWFISQSRTRHITKTRQCGADWYFSLEALIDAIETGRNQYFLAPAADYAVAQNRQRIVYFSALAGVEIPQDGSSIQLANGAEIGFMGEYDHFAAKHGNVYVSEYAWAEKPANLFKVAKGLAAQVKYRFTAYTTPSQSDEAYRLWATEKPENQQRLSAQDAHAQESIILDLPALKSQYPAEDFDMLFSAVWPQEKNKAAK